MPKMVRIGANKDYRPTAETAVAFAAIKKAGEIEVPYLTAIENCRNSGGMYAIMPEKAPTKVKVDTDLNELSNQELKVMMLNLGIKTEKVMKRTDIIALIERKLDSVEVVDGED